MGGGLSYVFDAFELDVERIELRESGRRIELQPQVWHALLYLVRNAGRAVSKEELLDEAWGDAIVTDGAISQVISLARKALSDDGAQQRYIKTLRGHGFRFEGDVRRIVPRRSATPAFVGRERELIAIVERFESVRDGHGTLLLVAGEPGVGKTTLVERAVDAIVERGGNVYVGRCAEAEGAAAFAPWVQILSSVWSRQRARLHPGWIAGIDRMLPELATAGARLPEADATAEGNAERLRIFDAIARLVRDGVARPTVFVLEDLHAADEPSLLFLELLAQQLSDQRLLVIGTYRDTEPAPPTLKRVAMAPLQLEGLGPEAVSELVGDEVIARDVLDLTRGNPLFIHEVMRTLRLEGATAALPRSLDSLRIPDRVAQAVRRGLMRLPDDTRALLATAAVIGRDVDVTVLRHAASLPPDDVLARLGPAVAASWIRETAPGTFRFAHALVRDVLHADLLPADRARLHARVADVWEQIAPATSDAQASRLAFHHFHAPPTPRAVAFLVAAALAAHRRFAYEEAALWFERALYVETLRDPASPRRIELLVEHGASLRCSGNATRAMEVLDQAAALARASENPTWLARATDEHAAAQKNAFDPSLIARLQQALAGLPAEPTELRTRIMARLAAALTFAPDADAPEQLGRAAVEAARGFSKQTLALALFSRRWSMRGPYRPEERLAISTEAVATALAAGDRSMACEARTWTVGDLLELGRRDDADRELAAQAREAAALHQPWHELIAARFRVVVALLDGRFGEADQLAEEALAFGTKGGDQNSQIIYWVQMIVLRREQGRYGELEPFARLMGDLTPWSPSWRCLLADVLCETGRADAAREIVATLAPNDFAAAPFDVNRPVAVALLASAVATLGDAANADALARVLAPAADHHIVVAGGSLYLGPVQRLLGRLCHATGRFDEAVDRLEAAARACDHIRAPAWKARTLFDLALVHRARGDLATADQIALTARAEAERMGMTDLALKLR